MAPASADHVSGHIVFSTSGSKINASQNPQECGGPDWDTGSGQQVNYSVPGTGGTITVQLSPSPTCIEKPSAATIIAQPPGWQCVFTESHAECSNGPKSNASGAGTVTIQISACDAGAAPNSTLFFDLECNKS